MNNQEILLKLRRLHTLLVLGKRSNNLAQAIRRAIDTISSWRDDAHTIIEKSPVKQLFAGYGPKFIKIFSELVQTGDISMIHDLQTEFDPFFCFLCEIPGIGETMARRMFYERSICSMDDLRIAYYNNILQRIPAFGDSRLKTIEILLWNSQNNEPPQNLLFDMANNDPALVTDSGFEHAITPSNAALEHIHKSMQLDLFMPPSDDSASIPRAEASPSSSYARHSFDFVRPDVPSDEQNFPFSKCECESECDINGGNENDALDINQNYRTKSLEILEILGNARDASSSAAHQDIDVQTIEDNHSSSEIECSNKSQKIESNSRKNDVEFSKKPIDIANAGYSRAFIESNSDLFREIPEASHIDDDTDDDIDEAPSEYFEDDLHEILEPVEKSQFDPKLNAELEAFIDKDLREHGIIQENCDACEVRIVRVQILRADRIDANIVRARLIRAEDIHIRPQNISVTSTESADRDILEVESLKADTIHADIIEVRSLDAHYIDARIMG